MKPSFDCSPTKSSLRVAMLQLWNQKMNLANLTSIISRITSHHQMRSDLYSSDHLFHHMLNIEFFVNVVDQADSDIISHGDSDACDCTTVMITCFPILGHLTLNASLWTMTTTREDDDDNDTCCVTIPYLLGVHLGYQINVSQWVKSSVFSVHQPIQVKIVLPGGFCCCVRAHWIIDRHVVKKYSTMGNEDNEKYHESGNNVDDMANVAVEEYLNPFLSVPCINLHNISQEIHAVMLRLYVGASEEACLLGFPARKLTSFHGYSLMNVETQSTVDNVSLALNSMSKDCIVPFRLTKLLSVGDDVQSENDTNGEDKDESKQIGLMPLPPLNSFLFPEVYTTYHNSLLGELDEKSAILPVRSAPQHATDILQIFPNANNRATLIVYSAEPKDESILDQFGDLGLESEDEEQSFSEPVRTSAPGLELDNMNAQLMPLLVSRVGQRYELLASESQQALYKGIAVTNDKTIFIGSSFWEVSSVRCPEEKNQIIQNSRLPRLVCAIHSPNDFSSKSFIGIEGMSIASVVEDFGQASNDFISLFMSRQIQVHFSKDCKLYWSYNANYSAPKYYDSQKIFSFKPTDVVWPIFKRYRERNTYMNMNYNIGSNAPLTLANLSALVFTFPNDANESLISRELANNMQKLSSNQPVIKLNEQCSMDVHLCGVSLCDLKFRVVDSIPLPILNTRQLLNEARRVAIRSKNEDLQTLVDSSDKHGTINELRERFFKMCDVTFITDEDEIRIQWPICFASSIPNRIHISFFHQNYFQLNHNIQVYVHVHSAKPKKRSCNAHYHFQANQITWNTAEEYPALIEVKNL